MAGVTFGRNPVPRGRGKRQYVTGKDALSPVNQSIENELTNIFAPPHVKASLAKCVNNLVNYHSFRECAGRTYRSNKGFVKRLESQVRVWDRRWPRARQVQRLWERIAQLAQALEIRTLLALKPQLQPRENRIAGPLQRGIIT